MKLGNPQERKPIDTTARKRYITPQSMLKRERAFTITSDKFHEAKDEICTQILLQELAINFFSRSICDRDRFRFC
jgi:hypothetical protein